MTGCFLPDFSVMPAPGGVRALYRLFDDQPWRTVCEGKTKNAIIFKDAPAAIKAAKDRVRIMLNPHLESAKMEEEPETDPDLLQVQKWQADKAELYAKTRAMIKNGKNRRQVVVEIKPSKKRKG